MLFSSVTFLYYFLPAVLLTYFLVPRNLKNTVLLLFSLVFYGWGEPKLLGLMVFTILMFYFCGLMIGRCRSQKGKKAWLTVSVVISIGLLGLFKYADFFIDSFNAVTGLSVPLLRLALPVGISFYTFQSLSYTIDVYRGNVPAQKNPISFGAYVALFPQLIAGPIVRYVDVARELNERQHSWEDFCLGLRRFLVGLGKKILIADNFALLMKLFRESEGKSVLFYWLYAVAFMLNIYFDFSGYSDMAIGLGRIFGFRFIENFNYPYLSKSVTEFWRRWHMSLGSWFRDYIYIPLGGNRVSKGRLVFNLLIVWAATGIWHGASWNFLFWGLFYFVLLVFEKFWFKNILDKLPRWVGHIYGLFLVLVGWTIFAVEDMAQLGGYLKAMFGFGAGLWDTAFLYNLRNYLPLLLIAAVASTPLAKKVWGKLPELARKILLPILLICGLFLATAYLVDGTYNPFLYFRF